MSSGVVTSEVRETRGCRSPGLLQRLWVRLNAKGLDRALAAGVDPNESAELSMRARQLVDRRERERIAVSIQGLLDLASRSQRIYLGFSRIPIDRAQVQGSRRELERVAEILRGPKRVSPPGVAMAHRLMTDFRGPIYTSGRITRLPEALGNTLSALEA